MFGLTPKEKAMATAIAAERGETLHTLASLGFRPERNTKGVFIGLHSEEPSVYDMPWVSFRKGVTKVWHYTGWSWQLTAEWGPGDAQFTSY